MRFVVTRGGCAPKGRGRRRRQAGDAGFTMLEVMLAMAILGFVTTILWGTFTQTATIKKRTEAAQDRTHSARVALMRMSREIEMAFLSGAENLSLAERRTMFTSTQHRDVDELRFSWLGRQRMRGDVPEGDAGVVTYYAETDPTDRSVLNLMRRETRRLEAIDPKSLPGESYILCPGIAGLKFSFYDFVKREWRDTWATSGVEGLQYLPSHVRITLVLYDDNLSGKTSTFTSSARIMLTEKVDYKTEKS